MKQAPRILPSLSLEEILNPQSLETLYADLQNDYYWSEDFSAEFYIAQAKAGFIAVTEMHKGNELLLPELQRSYAVLDFADVHIGRHVRRILRYDDLSLHVGFSLHAACERIRAHHKYTWITPRYIKTLEAVNAMRSDVHVVSVLLRHEEKITAGEIGYMIGRTYTSLSGFSSRDRRHQNHGTTQLVLLSQWLERHDFAFWNLGQPYMPYKFALGAKEYPRHAFLQRWSRATKQALSC
jgi:Leu/Phe-tRNA-protein transferase